MSPKILCALCALSLATISHAAPAKPPITAKSQIDARGVAALDRSIAYYQSLKSFSVSATETVSSPSVVPIRTCYELDMEGSARVALRATTLAATAQPPFFVGLLNADSQLISVNRQPAQKTPITNLYEHRSFYLRFFSSAPALANSFGLLADDKNPAQLEGVQSVRLGTIRAQGRALKNVIVTRQFEGEAAPTILEYRLSPQTNALETLVMRVSKNGVRQTVVVDFDPPRSNWRGSQNATDAAIYSWKKLAPGIAIAAARPKAIVSVDTRARAVFARATALYQALDGFHLVWKASGFEPEFGAIAPYEAALDFERAGHLRLRDKGAIETLIVVDGQNIWSVDELNFNDEGEQIVTYTREKLDKDEAAVKALFEIAASSDATEPFGDMLEGTNRLDAEQVTAQVEGAELLEFQAVLLPAQPLNGGACDLVRITTSSNGEKWNPKSITTDQKTYWFARKNGRLMRVQVRSAEGNEKPRTSDSQFTAQEFNPQFAPNTFKFVPPKGATLKTD